MKTKILLSIAFVLLLASGYAVTINAPSEITDQSILYFNVNLDSSANETKVLLDNKLMVTVYSDQTVVKHAKNVLDAFTLDSDPSSAGGLKLYVVLIGLEAGSHSLKATGNAGDDSKTITVSSALTQAFKSETESKLNELTGSSSVLSERLDSHETTLANQTTQINSLSGDVSSTKSSLDSLKQETDSKFSNLEGLPSQIESLNSKLNAEMRQNQETKEALEAEITELEGQVNAKIDNPLTGLTSMGDDSGGDLLLPLVGLLAVIIIGFVYLNRSRFFSPKETIYSGETGEAEAEEVSPEEQKEIEEAVEQKRQGKWAFKGEGSEEDSEEESKPKLSSLSSLLKKD